MQDLEFLFTLTAEADRVRARALLLVFEKFLVLIYSKLFSR